MHARTNHETTKSRMLSVITKNANTVQYFIHRICAHVVWWVGGG